jgi:signal transduction histidine kinase
MAGRVRALRDRRATQAHTPTRGDDLFDRLVHDLRNPVGVIAYYAEAVPTAEPSERDELCERLRVNAQRALHVLDEFALLAELRAGRGRLAAETCDVAELTAELAAELEALERRPGRIHRQVTLAAPLRVAPLHIVCVLRALLRVALRATAADDPLQLEVYAERHQTLFRITAALRSDPAIGLAATLPTAGIEIELAERVAALYDGRYTLAQGPGRGVMTLALSLPS